MKEIDSKLLKEIQLNILSNFASYCELNNVKYWLECGTLLGAIRHNGYIPWDDDIDIGMLRDDFNKIVDNFNKSNQKYKIISLNSDPDFYLPFAKIADTGTILYEPNEKGAKLNVNIDIFIYDNAKSIKSAKSIMKRRNAYRTFDYIRNYHLSYAKKINAKALIIKTLSLFFMIFPKNFFNKKIYNISIKYDNDKTEFIANLCGYYCICLENNFFDDLILCEFEGKKFKIPKQYDFLLKELYGDYMRLPPEDKRVSHHAFKAYVLDK